MVNHDEYARALGRAIKLARQRAGLSQSDVVKRLRVAKQQTISNWERGTYPSIQNLADFCEVVGMPMANLFSAAEKLLKRGEQ